MKKIFFTLLATVAVSGLAHAQATDGFEGPSVTENTVVTVEDAVNLNDDAKVTLKGQLVNSLGDEKYTFKDQTGEIVVEIDDEDFNGVKVTPENVVEISGEVDRDINEPVTIDVDRIEVK